MSIKFTTQVKGLAELEKKLRALPTAVAGKALRSALMSAVTPIQKAAKQNVAKDTGALADAIRKSSRLGPKSEFAAEAGIRMDVRKGKAGWRWHLEEFGYHRVGRGDLKAHRRERKRSKTKVREGQRSSFGTFVPARPVLRPAFDSQGPKALQIFKEKLAANILKQSKSTTPVAAPAVEPDQ